jgi:hypothetical protein
VSCRGASCGVTLPEHVTYGGVVICDVSFVQDQFGCFHQGFLIKFGH